MNELAAQATGVIIKFNYLGSVVFFPEQLMMRSGVMLAQSLMEANIRVVPVSDGTAPVGRFAGRTRITLFAGV